MYFSDVYAIFQTIRARVKRAHVFVREFWRETGRRELALDRVRYAMSFKLLTTELCHFFTRRLSIARGQLDKFVVKNATLSGNPKPLFGYAKSIDVYRWFTRVDDTVFMPVR